MVYSITYESFVAAALESGHAGMSVDTDTPHAPAGQWDEACERRVHVVGGTRSADTRA